MSEQIKTKIGRNDYCSCGSGKKYKKCCLKKDEEKRRIIAMKKAIDVKKISRADLLFNPFTTCPKCGGVKSYGVSPLSRSNTYAKECIKCWYSQSYPLPKLNKKLIYLDQFIISNLAKLLDPSNKSHQEIKQDSFWENLFVRLEKLRSSNLIICPDTFYHRNESIVGGVPFHLMERLYEHFSDGKTFLPHLVVYRYQIKAHFEHWIKGSLPMRWDFNPRNIAWEDFNEWAYGFRVSVRNSPRKGERDKLLETNDEQKTVLEKLWKDWKNEEPVSYKERVERELLGFKKLLFGSAQEYNQNQLKIAEKIASGGEWSDDLVESILPPLTNDILEDIARVARPLCNTQEEVALKINNYLNDPMVLAEVPGLKISSLMYAGLAHRANKSTQKRAPKSMNDIHFISAYLPYCDAVFLDRECKSILKDIPKNLPEAYRLNYQTKLFSFANKQEFLDYLDNIYNSATLEHMQAVRELHGEDREPFWSILINERASREADEEEASMTNQPPIA